MPAYPGTLPPSRARHPTAARLPSYSTHSCRAIVVAGRGLWLRGGPRKQVLQKLRDNYAQLEAASGSGTIGMDLNRPGRPGRLSGLSVFVCKYLFYKRFQDQIPTNFASTIRGKPK